MEKEEKLYLKISDALITKDDNITHGKMMTSPALKYKNKVFAFFITMQLHLNWAKNLIQKKTELNDGTILVLSKTNHQ